MVKLDLLSRSNFTSRDFEKSRWNPCIMSWSLNWALGVLSLTMEKSDILSLRRLMTSSLVGGLMFCTSFSSPSSFKMIISFSNT